MSTPIHAHDCAQCRYMGHVEAGHRSGDAYICAYARGTTLLLRYGPDGDYSSYSLEDMSNFREIAAERPDWWFSKVLKLAKEGGFLDPKYL